jgi:hypothetical protein
MSYVQLVVEEPDVGLDARTAGSEGGEEGNPSPVVVV